MKDIQFIFMQAIRQIELLLYGINFRRYQNTLEIRVINFVLIQMFQRGKIYNILIPHIHFCKMSYQFTDVTTDPLQMNRTCIYTYFHYRPHSHEINATLLIEFLNNSIRFIYRFSPNI